MEVKAYNENGLSEKSKEALQSETWNQARVAIKTEIRHFTASNENIENTYGAKWSEIVMEYLNTGYSQVQAHYEIEYLYEKYKILKREGVTSFYDADGNTLFDVENARLAKEYEDLMKGTAEPEKETECQRAKRNEGQEKDAESDKEISSGNVSVSTPEGIEDRTSENEKSVKEVAKEKLEAELKSAKDKSFAEPIINYLLKRCADDEGLATDVVQSHKTWEKCFSFLFNNAKNKAKGNYYAVQDEVVYEWAEDYFHLDDKDLEEKKRKEEGERKRIQALEVKKNLRRQNLTKKLRWYLKKVMRNLLLRKSWKVNFPYLI